MNSFLLYYKSSPVDLESELVTSEEEAAFIALMAKLRQASAFASSSKR